MPNLFSRLVGKTESNQEFRLSLGQAAGMYGTGNDSFGMWRSSTYGNRESETSDDFVGLINGAMKSSGVVWAVMLSRMTIFSEARFQWQPLSGGKPSDKLFGTEELGIFENPWPNGGTGEFLARCIQDADLCGNAYIVRENGVNGKKDRLRRLRPDWVQIVLRKDDNPTHADVVGYIYKENGSAAPKDWTYYDIDGSNGRIAHWSPLPDPDALFRGMSWLTPVLSEIMADKQSTKHKLKFFQNGATPNLAVSFKETVTEEQFGEFMKKMDQTHAGVDEAYKTLYLGGGADVKVVGNDIKQMDFKSTQGAAETRIAAAGGVPPSIVGLSEGLQGSSLNGGNFEASKNLFGDRTLRPLWRGLCQAMSVLVDPPNAGCRLWYDTSDINFLRQDRKDQAELQANQAETISKYVMNGFTPESAVEAVNADDLGLLKHTGLVSVQLLPPGAVAKDAAAPPDAEADPKAKDDKADPKAKAPAKAGQATTNTPPIPKK